MANTSDRERPSASPVESVDRALRVLGALATAGPEGVSLGGIATTLTVHKTTLHRILGALRFRDFVSQDPRTGNYALGPAALGIGEAFFSEENLPALLHPALVALSNDVDELVHLGSLSGAYVVYLEKVEPERAIRVWSSVGQRMPVVTTAMGRALLSVRDTDHTLFMSYLRAVEHSTDVEPDRVWRSIELARTRGYAIEEQENEPGVSCVAVPLLWSGRPIAAVSVTAPSERMTGARFEAVYARMLAVLPSLLPDDFTLPSR